MSECKACVYIEPDEYVNIISFNIRRSRGKIKCNECKRIIKKGNKYYADTFIFDNRILTHKTCMDCVSVRDQMFCGTWTYGEIWNDLREHIFELNGEVPESCMDKLTPVARNGVLDIIQEVFDRINKNGD